MSSFPDPPLFPDPRLSAFISGKVLFFFVSSVVQALALCHVIVLSSSTSSGHSGQLCFQQTIPSHPSTGCRCNKKFLLSYSNSSFCGCHFSGSISRIASQSGKA